MVVAASCMGGVAAQLSRRLGHNTLSKITDDDSSKFSQRYDASESDLPQVLATGFHWATCTSLAVAPSSSTTMPRFSTAVRPGGRNVWYGFCGELPTKFLPCSCDAGRYFGARLAHPKGRKG